ncbi:MAG: hypothetical protein HUU16_19985 [Candidatus Omnitrophica bacterium]|nr:hypothetical protein [bacterium]NUN98446.1 hypothetical protein [Candidatus Omnitrophota bacterium]
MNFGRLITGAIILFVLYALFRGFFKDVKENTPPPIKYDIRFDARIIPEPSGQPGPSSPGMTVLNTNNFDWPQPTFSINAAYRYNYPGVVKGGETLTLDFKSFKNDKGEVFPGQPMFRDFDVRTATMASSGKR